MTARAFVCESCHHRIGVLEDQSGYPFCGSCVASLRATLMAYGRDNAKPVAL